MKIKVGELKKLIKESLEETLTSLNQTGEEGESVMIGGEEAKKLIAQAKQVAQEKALKAPGARQALFAELQRALGLEPQNESVLLKNIIKRTVRTQLKK